MTPTENDDAALFAARAQPLGTEVSLVDGVDAARRLISAIAGDGTVVRGTADAVTAGLATAAAGRADAVEAGVAVSVARAGIVETGSVVIAPRDRTERLLHVLAPTQVVVVPRARLLPTLDEAFAELGDAPPPYASVVTGPSRTADIERVITIGAHGPRRLQVIVVGGWPHG